MMNHPQLIFGGTDVPRRHNAPSARLRISIKAQYSWPGVFQSTLNTLPCRLTKPQSLVPSTRCTILPTLCQAHAEHNPPLTTAQILWNARQALHLTPRTLITLMSQQTWLALVALLDRLRSTARGLWMSDPLPKVSRHITRIH